MQLLVRALALLNHISEAWHISEARDEGATPTELAQQVGLPPFGALVLKASRGISADMGARSSVL